MSDNEAVAAAKEAAARLMGGGDAGPEVVLESGPDQGDPDEDPTAASADPSTRTGGGGGSRSVTPPRRATVQPANRGGRLSMEDILSDVAQSDTTDELTMMENAEAYAKAALRAKADPAMLGRIKAKLERDDPELKPYIPQVIMDLLNSTPPAATLSGASGGTTTDAHRLPADAGTQAQHFADGKWSYAVREGDIVRVRTKDGNISEPVPYEDFMKNPKPDSYVPKPSGLAAIGGEGARQVLVSLAVGIGVAIVAAIVLTLIVDFALTFKNFEDATKREELTDLLRGLKTLVSLGAGGYAGYKFYKSQG